MKPVIGVTGPDHGGTAAWYFTRRAIRRAGGAAVRIRPGRPRDLAGLDGLVVGGGADVDPGLYGEQEQKPLRALRNREPSLARLAMHLALFPLIYLPRRLLSTHRSSGGDKARDDMESRLLRAALKRGLPILGICRGAQILNVVSGGSLYQDLSDFYVETPNARTIWPLKRVHLARDSRLAHILGTTNCAVNSLHNQAIREPGHELRPVAFESNSVIQAIEHVRLPCVFGVQWHPEYLPQREEQRRLFRKLVDCAREGAVRSSERECGVD